jgi:hypothetical protein
MAQFPSASVRPPEEESSTKQTEQPIFAAFREHLSKTSLSKSTQKTLVYGLRRAIRDLSTEDMTSPAVLAEYRRQLKQGSRNLHDTMWKRLSEMLAQHGIVLPEPDPIPRIRFVHPLYSSGIMLSIVADYDVLPTKTWGDLLKSQHAGDTRVVAAARRFWDYQTARLDEDGNLIVPNEPKMDDPLVPDGLSNLPMRAWRVRAIVNSKQYSAVKDHIHVLADLVDALCWAGMGGVTLHWLTDPVFADKNGFLRSRAALEAMDTALQYAKKGDSGAAFHFIAGKWNWKR